MPHRILPACLLLLCLLPDVRAAEHPLMIDLAQSRVDVAVTATMDSFVAHLTQYQPSVVLASDGSVRSASLVFNFRDLITGKPARDKAMYEWEQIDAFPEGRFVLSALKPAADNQFTAIGRLTFHGVARDVQFPVSLSHEGTRLAIDGEATVDTREFGLPVIRKFGVLKVNPVVRVRFHLQGAAAGHLEVAL